LARELHPKFCVNRPITSLLVAGALIAALGSSACVRGGGRAALGALHVAAAIAEVVAVAATLAHHDAHFHGRRCGHSYRWYEGRYNYWYNGRWEYHDDGVWYAY
jgi:hypothetical protein